MTLMVSPFFLGRFGTIVSICSIFICFVTLYERAWVEKQQYYMLVHAFNAAAVMSILVIDSLYRKMKTEVSRLHADSITDDLTGLYNRRYFDLQLEHCWNNYEREGTAMSLLIIDVDKFKQVNDNLGHDVGDMVLASIGKIIKDNVRGTDIPCRIGGDEFAVILHSNKREGIELIINRFRQSVRELMERDYPSTSVSLSIGGSSAAPPMKCHQEIYKSADSAMYLVKQRGRDGFHLTGPVLDP